MRARPSTQFELPLGPVFDAPVGRFETCAQVTQMFGIKESNEGTALNPVRAIARFRIRLSRWSLHNMRASVVMTDHNRMQEEVRNANQL